MSTTLQSAVSLLSDLIRIPSFSREEQGTAACLTQWALQAGLWVDRCGNNVWSIQQSFNANRPTLVLLSHHDTVKPNAGYTRDPFQPTQEEGKLFGLGSNDAGASLVAQALAFHAFHTRGDLGINLIWLAAAEEEVSGSGGVSAWLANPTIQAWYQESVTHQQTWSAIVGEPTGMQLAIAERGLLVVDGLATGVAGHAARNEGDNAIYHALQDIQSLQALQFPDVSEWLGETRLTVTAIQTDNQQHNVIPDRCSYVVDVRLNEWHPPEEVLARLQANVKGVLSARSFRLRPTFIPPTHPLVKAGAELGMRCVGSPTLSDKALLPFPAVKCGPGDSARSHTADEFVYLEEISAAIDLYIQWIERYQSSLSTDHS